MIIEMISNGFILLGIFFLCLGVYGQFKYKDFYTRILVASKVDTVGFLLIVIGMILRHGFSFFSGKLVLIGLLIVTLNPFVAAILVRSAFSDSDMKRPEGAEDLPVALVDEAENSIDGPWGK